MLSIRPIVHHPYRMRFFPLGRPNDQRRIVWYPVVDRGVIVPVVVTPPPSRRRCYLPLKEDLMYYRAPRVYKIVGPGVVPETGVDNGPTCVCRGGGEIQDIMR